MLQSGWPGTQDENFNPLVGRSIQKQIAGKENPFTGSKAFTGVLTSIGTPKPQTARKALGNIGKTFMAARTPHQSTRKALGDITNVAQSAKHENLYQEQKLLKGGFILQSESPRPQAETFAESGVEGLAGKSCQQLEDEMEQRENEKSNARVRAAGISCKNFQFSTPLALVSIFWCTARGSRT